MDHIPCLIFPKLSKGYVVEMIRVSDFISHEKFAKEVNELLNYWMVIHGIKLNHIEAIVKIMFHNSEQIFSYPIECITSLNPFVSTSFKQSRSLIISEMHEKLKECFKKVRPNQ